MLIGLLFLFLDYRTGLVKFSLLANMKLHWLCYFVLFAADKVSPALAFSHMIEEEQG